jgi:ribonuclease HIII
MVRAGVRDSKRLSDKKAVELSRWITTHFVHSIVTIGPEKYNQLYSRIRNLNKLLAWGHSRIIENIAEENAIEVAISDKFGRDDFIEKALMAKGRKLQVRQEIRAESIPQVAAASILARAAFIQNMEKLSGLYGMEIPKGAGAPVDKVAAALIARYGKEALDKIAKVHFKNYLKAVD